MRFEGTTALITGASSGIGAEFARRLAARGADVVLVARRKDVLDDVAADIRRASGRTVHVLPWNLLEADAGVRLVDAVRDLGIAVDTVVNCAGAGRTVDFASSDLSDAQSQLRLNVEVVVEISHAFLPQLTASGRGALVNVASLTAYFATPRMAVYAASKAFVLRFTEALAYEVRGSRLRVLALAPGPTRSDFFRASSTAARGVRFEDPSDVVTVALEALDARRSPVSVVSGFRNRVTSRVLPLLPVRLGLRLASSTSG